MNVTHVKLENGELIVSSDGENFTTLMVDPFTLANAMSIEIVQLPISDTIKKCECFCHDGDDVGAFHEVPCCDNGFRYQVNTVAVLGFESRNQPFVNAKKEINKFLEIALKTKL